MPTSVNLTTKTGRTFFIPALDGLRFISFLLIYIHHADHTGFLLLDAIKQVGWIGVDVFFCLSGFLLTSLLMSEVEQTGGISLPKFFMRRVLRIWPLYFTYALFLLTFYFARNEITRMSIFRAVGLLTFTDNILASAYGYNPINFVGHLWTIAYEEQFYLLIPFLILFLHHKFRTKQWLVLSLAVLTGFAIRFIFIFYETKHPAIWVLPFTHFESIVAGITLARVDFTVLTRRKWLIILLAVSSLVSIFLLPGTNVTGYHLMVLYPCIGLFTGSLLCLTLSADGILKQVLTTGAITYLGKVSYGLYVFHGICLVSVGYALKKVMHISFPPVTMIIALLLTILLAVLSYTILEKTFLRLKNRFTVIHSRKE